MFSKSFGYALRGILFVALYGDESRNIHVDEVAEKLRVPRHFMGKIMKNLVKHGVLNSTKGPYGGFHINDTTLNTSVLQVVEITDGLSAFRDCVLRVNKCNPANPCPMHCQLEKTKESLEGILRDTTIGNLLDSDKEEFIKSISTTVSGGVIYH